MTEIGARRVGDVCYKRVQAGLITQWQNNVETHHLVGWEATDRFRRPCMHRIPHVMGGNFRCLNCRSCAECQGNGKRKAERPVGEIFSSRI
ncbi:hypothetical protein GCM10007862_17230 [Dyella lipolytica]|nr:hypothetical protein GCM10007862_17230 [Dyella lipolytica]